VPGVVHELGLYVPSLEVPRAEPCEAYVGQEVICGATPASLFRKTCGVESHSRNIWLCPIHAAVVACGGATCHDCAIRGGVAPIVRMYLISEPLRFG
jgi:hypothetical protein